MANQKYFNIFVLSFLDRIEGIEHDLSYLKKSAKDINSIESVEHHDTYVGKRIKRGLFRTKDGILLNADVNGSYNIMRKVKGDAVMPPYTGFGYNPVKKFIN